MSPVPEPSSPVLEWSHRRKRSCVRRSRKDMSVFLWPSQDDPAHASQPFTGTPALNVVGPNLLPWPLHPPCSHQALQPELPIAPVLPSGSLQMHADHAPVATPDVAAMSVSQPTPAQHAPFVLQQREQGHLDFAGAPNLPAASPPVQGAQVKAEAAASPAAPELGALEQEPLLQQLREHLSRSAAAGAGTAAAASPAVNAAATPSHAFKDHALEGRAAAAPAAVDQIALLEKLRAGGGNVGMSVTDLSSRLGSTPDPAQRIHTSITQQEWNASHQGPRQSAPMDSLKGALQQLQQRAGQVAQAAAPPAAPQQSLHELASSGPAGQEAQLQAQMQSQLLASLVADNTLDSRRDLAALVQALKQSAAKSASPGQQAPAIGPFSAMKASLPLSQLGGHGQAASDRQQVAPASAQTAHHAPQQQQQSHSHFPVESPGPVSRQVSSSGATHPAKPLSPKDTNGPVTLSSLCQPGTGTQDSIAQMTQLPSKEAANALLHHFGFSVPNTSAAPATAKAEPSGAPASSAFTAATAEHPQPGSMPHSTQHASYSAQPDRTGDVSAAMFQDVARAVAGTPGAAGGLRLSPEHLQILQTLAAVEQQRNQEAAVSAAAQQLLKASGRISLTGNDLTQGHNAQHAAHALLAQQLQQANAGNAVLPARSNMQQQQLDGSHTVQMLEQAMNASRQSAAAPRDDGKQKTTAAQDLISHLSQQNAQQNSAAAPQSSAALELKNRMLQQLSMRVGENAALDGSAAASEVPNGSPQRIATGASHVLSAQGLESPSVHHRHSNTGASPPAHPASMPQMHLSHKPVQVHTPQAMRPGSNTALHSQEHHDVAANVMAGQSPSQLLSQVHAFQPTAASQAPASPVSGSALARAAFAACSAPANHVQQPAPAPASTDAASQLVLQMLMSQQGSGAGAGQRNDVLGAALNDAARTIMQNREREAAAMQQQSRGVDLNAQRLQLAAQFMQQQQRQQAATTAIQNQIDQGHAQQQQQALLMQLLQQAMQQNRGATPPNNPPTPPAPTSPAPRSPSQQNSLNQQQQKQAMLQLLMQQNSAAQVPEKAHHFDRDALGRVRAGSDPGALQGTARMDSSPPNPLPQHVQQLLSKHLASSMQPGTSAPAHAMHASGNQFADVSAVNQLLSACSGGEHLTPEKDLQRVASSSHVPLSGSLSDLNMAAQRTVSCGGAIGSGASGHAFHNACAALQASNHAVSPPTASLGVPGGDNSSHAAAVEAADVLGTPHPDSEKFSQGRTTDASAQQHSVEQLPGAPPMSGALPAQEHLQEAGVVANGPKQPVPVAPQEATAAEGVRVSETGGAAPPIASAIDAQVQREGGASEKAAGLEDNQAHLASTDQAGALAPEASHVALEDRAGTAEKQQEQPAADLQAKGGGLQCKSRPSSADSHESAFELAVG